MQSIKEASFNFANCRAKFSLISLGFKAQPGSGLILDTTPHSRAKFTPREDEFLKSDEEPFLSEPDLDGGVLSHFFEPS